MKIVILDGYAANPGDLSWEGIAQFGDLTVYDRTAPEQLLSRMAGAEVVFVNKTPLPRQAIAACPALKMIGVLATGYNIVDIAAAREHGVTVCNIPAYSTESVAQMTFALLLEICQQVGAHSAACHAGQWERSPDFCFWNYPLTELSGKTMGIVGYGQIGQAVGRIARAFGMKLLVNAAHIRPELEADDCHYVPLPALYAQSDVVSLHCPQTAQTVGMIDASALSQMKDGVILLNTSRGSLIDESALSDALRSGKVRAAGLDVVSREPILPDNPLLSAPNCFLTPHIAWAPLEARTRLMQIAEDNLRAYCAGAPIHVVN